MLPANVCVGYGGGNDLCLHCIPYSGGWGYQRSLPPLYPHLSHLSLPPLYPTNAGYLCLHCDRKKPPPLGGFPIYYDPSWRTVKRYPICIRFFEGDPLPHGSWWGKIVNRKPPRGGRFFSINCIRRWRQRQRSDIFASTVQGGEDSKDPLSCGYLCLHCIRLCLHPTFVSDVYQTSVRCWIERRKWLLRWLLRNIASKCVHGIWWM